MRLKEICQEKGITQEKMAEDLGVDDRTVRRWMKGRLSTENYLLLSEYLDIAPCLLVEEDKGECTPEFVIGKTGSIKREVLENEMLKAIKILRNGDVVDDIYNQQYISVTDEMVNDILTISLRLTDIFSRLFCSLYSKKWRSKLPILDYKDDDMYPLKLRLSSNALFHHRSGVLRSEELNNAFSEAASICFKYNNNPFVLLFIQADVGGIFVSSISINDGSRLTLSQQITVCEFTFLRLLHLASNSIISY